MRRYIPLLLAGLCTLFVILAALLYTTQFVGQKNEDNKLVPVIKTLTVYTTIPADMASIIANEYRTENNVQINFVPLSTEELQDKIKNNALSDVDMVLTDSELLEQMAAANELEGNISEREDIVQETFKGANNQWIGIWYDPIVFCYNTDYIKNTWQIPLTWEALAQRKDIKIAMTDFMVASAASNILYSLVETKGEDAALNIVGGIHLRVVRYAKYLSTPVRMAGMAEADVAIAVQSETLRYVHDNYPLSIIYPKDGTAYQLTGVGVIKSSQEKAAANDFVQWLLGDEVQLALQSNRYFLVPTNYSSLTYKEFAGKNIRFFQKQIHLDDNSKKIVLNRWVTDIRLNN